MDLQNLIPENWKALCDLELLQSIESKIDWSETVYPPTSLIFNALQHTAPEDVKVVILGQDPYHGPNQAMGLSFSVPREEKIPPSLRNIFKEIQASTGELCATGNLENWARQGILLLNSVLTVVEASAGAHKKTGWMDFTQSLLKNLSQNHEGIVFLLWGGFAKEVGEVIATDRNHLLLHAPHPSPLSAHRGFLGCNHFVEVNEFLEKSNKQPIEWGTI